MASAPAVEIITTGIPNGPNAAATATAIQSATIAAPIAIRMITITSNTDRSPDCIVSYMPYIVYKYAVTMPVILPSMSRI